MTTKKKPAAEKPAKQKNTTHFVCKPDEDDDSFMARQMIRPEIQAAATIKDWTDVEVDFVVLSEELSAQADKLSRGNMQRAESMLLAQAQTLDSIFNHLARVAKKQEYAKHFEMYLRRIYSP